MSAKTTMISSRVTKDRVKVTIPLQDLIDLLVIRGLQRPIGGTTTVNLNSETGEITVIYESDPRPGEEAHMEEIALSPREGTPLYTIHDLTEYRCQEPDCVQLLLRKAKFRASGKEFQICTNCGTTYLRPWDMAPYHIEGDSPSLEEPITEEQAEAETEAEDGKWDGGNDD